MGFSHNVGFLILILAIRGWFAESTEERSWNASLQLSPTRNAVYHTWSVDHYPGCGRYFYCLGTWHSRYGADDCQTIILIVPKVQGAVEQRNKHWELEDLPGTYFEFPPLKLRKGSNKELEMSRKLIGLMTVAVSGIFMVGTASAEITGSAHDLKSELFGTAPSGEICVVCHAPHDNQNASGSLLWNHDASSWAGAFTVYSSGTLDGAAGQPGETSTLCLGCHDGTIAVDSYGGASGTLKIDGVGGNFGDVVAFGQDLGNDHPVGVTYATGTGTLFDSEIKAVTEAVNWSDGSTAGTIADILFANKVECASCHDVHNTKSNTANSLLNVKNDGSALCLTCHSK